MVKKLKSKIFYFLMIFLTVITIGIILIFTIYNYNNTINTSTFFIDRVYGLNTKENNKNKDKEEFEDVREQSQITEIEGFYSILIKNDKIISDNKNLITEEIEKYALEASNKKSENGIVGNYIYSIKSDKEEKIVMLVENEEAIMHIKILIIVAIVISVISVIIVYIIAKRISETIVKPVEDTFSKQKEFISDASHELKTPLAVIEANADVLESKIGKNKWINYIQNEIESMDKLINELLLLTKMENIDSIKEKKEFNLSQETELCISLFESMAYEKNIRIDTHIEKNIKLTGNKEDVKHILSTLIDNAIKHTKSNDKIEINLNKIKENIEIEIKNIGEEIPQEEREKIFERFYRIDKAHNREEKRYGLGLAIAKSTVEKYNGRIEVGYQDGYTIFLVKLPTKK